MCEKEAAAQYGQDLLQFGLRLPFHTSSTLPSTEAPSSTSSGPTSKTKSCRKMIAIRLRRATEESSIIKVKKVTKVNIGKSIYQVVNTSKSTSQYSVEICDVLSCSCPDFKKNGKFVKCKHIFFVLKHILVVNDEVLHVRHFESDDIKGIFDDAPKREVIDINRIFQNHRDNTRAQMGTIEKKTKRSTTCKSRNCKYVIVDGAICVSLMRCLVIPYNKDFAVQQKVYVCPKQLCLSSVPSWCNARFPIRILVNDEISSSEEINARNLIKDQWI